MKYWLITYLLFCFFPLFGQENVDEHIERLKEKYNREINLKCEILISVEVEGMVIPDKEVFVEFAEGQKPKIKGQGLSLLPKRGTLEQFRTLLSTPMQAIFLSMKGTNRIYKLVSLDPESDWITADILCDPAQDLIYECEVNTKKHGSFKTLNQYAEGPYPSNTIVTFEAKKFKLPLKFIGGEQSPDKPKKNDDEIMGKVILRYSYF